MILRITKKDSHCLLSPYLGFDYWYSRRVGVPGYLADVMLCLHMLNRDRISAKKKYVVHANLLKLAKEDIDQGIMYRSLTNGLLNGATGMNYQCRYDPYYTVLLGKYDIRMDYSSAESYCNVFFNQISASTTEGCSHYISTHSVGEINVCYSGFVLEQNYVPQISERLPQSVDIKVPAYKNSIASMFFIDFYREKWDEIDNIYVVGCGKAAYQYSAIAQFFLDKTIYYIDKDLNHMALRGLTNIIKVEDFIDQDFSFLPRSALISDIRKELDDASVIKDNLLQMSWASKVDIAMYKFRCPYYDQSADFNIRYDYVYVPPHRGQSSTECKILVSRESTNMIRINPGSYERRHAYFNNNVRFGSYCYDCSSRKEILDKFPVFLMFGVHLGLRITL
jgi:hypothetical protein